MPQPYSRTHYLAATVGMCVVAWVVFTATKPSPNLAADLRGFDASPTCHAERVLSAESDSSLSAPVAGSCVVQRVTVTGKTVKVTQGARSRTTQYWITVRLPWGAQHSTILRGGRTAFEAVVVGRPVNVLLWRERVAFLDVRGAAVSTSENPDVEHRVQIIRWLCITVALGLALVSLYRAVVGPA